ncbi:MAG: DUF11 domain-containing protein [Gemmatimonadales bacterium]|nr:DUF11 domain-containing protein [Gemmatimonadales bacterium]
MDKAEASPGDTVQYTIAFSNQGDTTVTSVAIIDPIPAHVTYVAGSTRLNGAPVDPDPYSDGQIRVAVGSLAPGAGGTISFQVRVK